MNLKPDPIKQAQKIIFYRKTTKKIYPKIFFNNIPVSIKPILKNIWACI